MRFSVHHRRSVGGVNAGRAHAGVLFWQGGHTEMCPEAGGRESTSANLQRYFLVNISTTLWDHHFGVPAAYHTVLSATQKKKQKISNATIVATRESLSRALWAHAFGKKDSFLCAHSAAISEIEGERQRST